LHDETPLALHPIQTFTFFRTSIILAQLDNRGIIECARTIVVRWYFDEVPVCTTT